MAIPTRTCKRRRRPVELWHGLDQGKSGPHGALGVVLMRLRIAEIDEHAIAHVLRDEAAEAAHGVRDALLISGNNLAKVFRVHACRQCR